MNGFAPAIRKRLDYLSDVLETDQDRSLFERTQNLLLEVFNQLEFESCPDIGVDDAGQTIAEWHNYDDYTIISVIPLSDDKILFEGVKKNATAFTITTTLHNLKQKYTVGITETSIYTLPERKTCQIELWRSNKQNPISKP
jgi:hypothetical protein